MFTVRVALEASGNSSTFRPFASRYSVMPSTEVTLVTPAGTFAGAVAALLAPGLLPAAVVAGAAGAADAQSEAAAASAPRRRRMFMGWGVRKMAGLSQSGVPGRVTSRHGLDRLPARGLRALATLAAG